MYLYIRAYDARDARKERQLKLKKTFSIITTALLVVVLLLAAALVGVRLFGITPYTVLSGSMEPTYHVGSLIYVKKVEPADLKVGDPLTYVIEGGTVVTHRIVDIMQDQDDPTQLRFKTKGDNNKIEDGLPVHSKNVLGKPILTIPLLGYVAHFIQTPPTSFLSIGICVVIVLLTFLPDLIDRIMGEGDAKPPGEQTCAQDMAFEGACEKPCCPDQESAPNAEDDGRPPPE